MQHYNLEICVDSVDAAIIASSNGATRLELCSNLIIGGTTPSLGLIELTRETVSIPVHALIRPRFGDFLYTPFEVEQMKRDILTCREHMLDGVVIGALTSDGHLDSSILKSLIDCSGNMHITLSRAFDVCKDPFLALETAIELGVHTILTSGQSSSCVEGLPLIEKLVKQANGRINIMPGAGLLPDNIKSFLQIPNINNVHLSAKMLTSSQMLYRNSDVNMGLPGISEDIIYSISESIVKDSRKILDNHFNI
ncbi:MAG: copper homeostasis protein CutC [Cellulosilyticaceae bacterium]